MKKFKKIIALGLAAMAAVSTMSMTAFAADNVDDVVYEYEVNDPYSTPVPTVEPAEIVSYTTVNGVEVPYEYRIADIDITDNAIMPLAEDVDEIEPNNDINSANRIYDDNNVYGKISYSGDVDWFKISFNNLGSVNFWLGSIPAGCNYDIYLYEQNGSYARLVKSSTNSSNKDELIEGYTCLANTNYYIKIASDGTYSSSKYLFRARMQ